MVGTTGPKIVTILVLVTMAPFVYCPMDGAVIVITQPFPLLLVVACCIRIVVGGLP